MKLQQLALEQIKPNPFQARMEFDEEKLEELGENIQKHGQIEPIVVTPDSAGGYMIVAGERRYRAHLKKNVPKVYAIIKDYKDVSDMRRDSLVENVMRENLTTSEFKAYCYQLAEGLGEPYYKKGWINVPALSEYVTGKARRDSMESPSPFYQKLSAIQKVQQKGTSQLKKALDEGRIDPRTAERIASVEDKAVQNELVNAAKSKTRDDIRAEVTRYNTQQRYEALRAEQDAEKKKRAGAKLMEEFNGKMRGYSEQLDEMFKHMLFYANASEQVTKELRLGMMDKVKPVKISLDKLTHATKKLMEALGK